MEFHRLSFCYKLNAGFRVRVVMRLRSVRSCSTSRDAYVYYDMGGRCRVVLKSRFSQPFTGSSSSVYWAFPLIRKLFVFFVPFFKILMGGSISSCCNSCC